MLFGGVVFLCYSPGPMAPATTPPTSRFTNPSGLTVRRLGALRYRFLKAYRVTFLVLTSYLWLNFKRRFMGREYFLGELPEVHRRNAVRIERAVIDLQGLFIKVGQLISIMTNVLPEEFRKPLESLQDAVPPRPVSEIKYRIQKELGAAPEKIFGSFDETPLASASLGQVHRAWLKDGTEVVVKVQHADIDEIVQLDLKTIWRIMTIIQWFVPIRGMDLVYRQIREMILQELDFVREAAFMESIGKNLATEAKVRVPRIFAEYSTGKILTSSFVEGVKISDIAALTRMGVDRHELADRLVRAYCKMVLVDGVYHADPHPGNILVTADGTIVLLDFGAVAELSPSMRQGIPDFLEAVIRRDTASIFRAMRRMGFIAQGSEAEAASERIIEYFHRRFQDEVKLESLNLKDIKLDPQKGLENFLDFRRQDISIRELTTAFQVPKDWVLLERTVLLLAGVCTHLAPDLNPVGVIRPYLEEFVLGKERDFASLFLNAVKDTALSALTIPDDLRKYLSKSIRGELELRFRGLDEGMSLLYAAAHQVIYALFAIAFGTAALAMHLNHVESKLVVLFAASSGVSALALLGSMIFALRYRRR